MSDKSNKSTDSTEKVILNNKLNKYFNLQQVIYEAFRYVEDWVVIPLSDQRDMFWQIIGLHDESGMGGSIIYYEEPLTEENLEKGKHYSAKIYTQRFLPRWIYRTDYFTLVCMDTCTDGNKYLGIFDNSKESIDNKNEQAVKRFHKQFSININER